MSHFVFLRSANRCAAIAVATFWLWAACSGTPGTLNDAAVLDGAGADATAIDATNPDAALPGPLPLTLTEMPSDYLGGREDALLLGLGSGAAAADIDNDGDLDLFLARCDNDTSQPGGPSLLLRNEAGGGPLAISDFTSDPLMEFGFSGVCAHAAAFGDYDRDGALDLMVVTNGPDRLYRNNGAGIFTDVTLMAGVGGPANGAEHSVYWADVNHDGLLDIFVPAHFVAYPPGPDPINANRLYLNRGSGAFTEIGALAGVAGDGSSQAAAITDLDGDGDLEIYLANDQFTINGEDQNMFGLDDDRWLDLDGYDEQGVPSYQDRAPEFGMAEPRASMGVAITDVNGDGFDDIYVIDWGANHLHVWNPASMNYDEVAADWNLDLADDQFNGYMVGWGAEFTDFDRDGRDEAIVVHGMVQDPVSCNDFAQFNLLMRRQRLGDFFSSITASVGWPTATKCPPEPSERPVGNRGVS